MQYKEKSPTSIKDIGPFLAGAEGLEPSARGFGAKSELYSHCIKHKNCQRFEPKNVDQMTTADSNKACFWCHKLLRTTKRRLLFCKILLLSRSDTNILHISIILQSAVAQVKFEWPKSCCLQANKPMFFDTTPELGCSSQ